MVQGIYREGAIELLEKVDMREGTKATVIFIESSKLSSDDEEMKLLQRWLEQGLISSIPDQKADEEEFEPILVKGKPVSGIIMADSSDVRLGFCTMD